jgi:toxin ParE1/3/4
MRYRLLPQAEQDIEAIADYIAERNPRAALELIERFHQRWELLCDFPLSGPARPDLHEDARHLIIGNYLSLYRVKADTVEIVRVLHGRRNIEPEDIG